MWSIVNCGGEGGERVIFSWEDQNPIDDLNIGNKT